MESTEMDSNLSGSTPLREMIRVGSDEGARLNPSDWDQTRYLSHYNCYSINLQNANCKHIETKGVERRAGQEVPVNQRAPSR